MRHAWWYPKDWPPGVYVYLRDGKIVVLRSIQGGKDA